jgi:hypothetical protein
MTRPRRLYSALGVASTGAVIVLAVWLGVRGSVRMPMVIAVISSFLVTGYLVRRRARGAPAILPFESWGEKYGILYRLIAASPECALFPDDATRHKVVQELNYGVLGRWWYSPVTLAVCLLLFLVTEPLATLISHTLPFIPWAVALIAIVMFWMGAFFGLIWVTIRHDARRRLRERLVAFGVPICVHCGYDLRGQTEPRCPECGRAFDPALLNRPCNDSPTRRP